MEYTGRCESSKERKAQFATALPVHRGVRACRRGRLHRPCSSIARLVDPGRNIGRSPRDGQRSDRRLHRGAHKERGADPLGHLCRNAAPRSLASCSTVLNAPAEPQTPAGHSGPSTSRLCCSPSSGQPRVLETSPQTGIQICVPQHSADLKRGLLHGILKDVRMSLDEFLRFL